MVTLWFICAGVSLMSLGGVGLVWLLAGDDVAGWRAVAGAQVAAPLRGVVLAPPGGAARTPHGDRSAAWWVTWAMQTSRDIAGEPGGGQVALFARSSSPVLVRLSGGEAVTVDPVQAWVQPAPGQDLVPGTAATMPFGAAPAHRALAFWPRTRSYEAFRDRRPTPYDGDTGVHEQWLEPGAEVELHGRVERTDAGPRVVPAREGVLVLRAGGETAHDAASALARARTRRRRLGHAALMSAASFVGFALAAGAGAGTT